MSEEYKSYLMSKIFDEDYDFYNEIVDRQWQHTRQCGKESNVKGIACKTCYPPPENSQTGLEFINFMEIVIFVVNTDTKQVNVEIEMIIKIIINVNIVIKLDILLSIVVNLKKRKI